MTDTVRVPREPTEAMLRAASEIGPDTPAGRFDYSDARAVWSAMLAASPQEAVPTKREAALADLAKLDGETMDLAASPQGEGSWADELARQIDILRRAAAVPVPDEDTDFNIEKARRGAASWHILFRPR